MHLFLYPSTHVLDMAGVAAEVYPHKITRETYLGFTVLHCIQDTYEHCFIVQGIYSLLS